MRTAALTAMMIAATGTVAAHAAHLAKSSVIVCAQMQASPESDDAETLASLMFLRIGVNVEWHGMRNCPDGAIRVSMAAGTPADFKPGALAYARPYEGTHIVVLMDRLSGITTVPARVLMAHVFAHEITHILQGVDRHSETGVMKAHWGSDDYRHMRFSPLGFTATDIQLIHLGLDSRQRVLAANAKMAQDKTEVAAISR